MMKQEKYKTNNKELQGLINALIKGDDSFADQYKNKKKIFSYKEINIANQKKLDDEYYNINELLENFQESYRQLFAIMINENTSEEDRYIANNYLKLCEYYINSIQNLYLNPINYRLNKMNAEKNMNKANKSIILGFVAIVFAIVSTLVTLCITKNQNYNMKEIEETINKIKISVNDIYQETKENSNIIYYENIQGLINKLLEQNEILIENKKSNY